MEKRRVEVVAKLAAISRSSSSSSSTSSSSPPPMDIVWPTMSKFKFSVVATCRVEDLAGAKFSSFDDLCTSLYELRQSQMEAYVKRCRQNRLGALYAYRRRQRLRSQEKNHNEMKLWEPSFPSLQGVILVYVCFRFIFCVVFSFPHFIFTVQRSSFFNIFTCYVPSLCVFLDIQRRIKNGSEISVMSWTL